MTVSLRRSAHRAAWIAAVVAVSCVAPAGASSGAAPVAASARTNACAPTNGGTGNAGTGGTNGGTSNGGTNGGTGNTGTPNTTPITSIRITQANLLSGQPQADFQADLCTVFSNRPDFITYNEVAYRSDASLAPEGYAVYRTPGKYTGETPVAWRTDRWEAINRGTTTISAKHGIVPGQKVEWGMRYANWVTVRSLDGQQTLSVVSTHIAPVNSITKNLLGPSLANLGQLVRGLSVQGPVFVGGDFNRPYRSRTYPRAQLTSIGLTPSYDVTGTYLPTGDHHGATIDYVFMRPASLMTVTSQTTAELNSDHDALSVVIGIPSRTVGERPVAFAPGTNVNDPTATVAPSRRAVNRTLRSAVRNAPKGAVVRVATTSLADRGLAADLRSAVRRGVEVRVVSGSTTPTAAEKSLVTMFRKQHAPRTWIKFRPGRFTAVAPTTVMVTMAGVTPTVTMKASRPLDLTMMREASQATTALSAASFQAGTTWFNRLAHH